MSQSRSGAPSRLVKNLAAFTAGIYFLSNAAFLHAAESNVWKERREQVAQALSPSRSSASQGSDSLQVLKGLPDLRPASPSSHLMEHLSADVPAGLLRRHAPLLSALPPVSVSVRRLSPPKRDGGKTVLFLQDVHMNDEVQRNLGDAVAALVTADETGKTPVSLVALEAAFGPMDLSAYRLPGDRDDVRAAADYFLAEHQISGPVHAAYTFAGDLPPIVGVDDPVHYRANIDAYRRSVPARTEARFRAAIERRGLEARKKSVFNDALFAFDRAVSAYEGGRLPFGAYVEALFPQGASARFLQAGMFLESLHMEKSLDFVRVEQERALLIEELVRRLPRPKMEALLQLSVAYRLGAVTHTGYYKDLARLCRARGVRLPAFPAMDGYLRYVILAGGVDADRLFKELSAAREEAYARLAATEGERNLVAQSRRLTLTDKLLDFSLTPDEWSEYSAASPLLSSPLVGEGGVRGGLDLSSFESFYKEADARNHAMTENLLKAMAGGNVNTAVFVAGGFHTAGMTRLLNDRGVTVIEAAPKLTKVEGEPSAYLSVFTQEKSPLEQLFKGNKLFVGDLANKAGESGAMAAIVALEKNTAAEAESAFSRMMSGARMLDVGIHENRASAVVVTSTGKARISLRRTGEGFRFHQTLVVGFLTSLAVASDTSISQGVGAFVALTTASHLMAPSFLYLLGALSGLVVLAVFHRPLADIARRTAAQTASMLVLALALNGCGGSLQVPAFAPAPVSVEPLPALEAPVSATAAETPARRVSDRERFERMLADNGVADADLLLSRLKEEGADHGFAAAVEAGQFEAGAALQAHALVEELVSRVDRTDTRLSGTILDILDGRQAARFVPTPVLLEMLQALADDREYEGGDLLVRTLVNQNDRRIVPALVDVLGKGREVHHFLHRAAIRGLGEIGDPRAVSALIGALNDPLRLSAAWNVPGMDTAVLPYVVQAEAVAALSSLGDQAKAAIPSLEKLAKSPRIRLREAARDALKKIKSAQIAPAGPQKRADASAPGRRHLGGGTVDSLLTLAMLGVIGSRSRSRSPVRAFKSRNPSVDEEINGMVRSILLLNTAIQEGHSDNVVPLHEALSEKRSLVKDWASRPYDANIYEGLEWLAAVFRADDLHDEVFTHALRDDVTEALGKLSWSKEEARLDHLRDRGAWEEALEAVTERWKNFTAAEKAALGVVAGVGAAAVLLPALIGNVFAVMGAVALSLLAVFLLARTFFIDPYHGPDGRSITQTVAAAVVAAGLILGGFFYHAKERASEWQGSKSRANLGAVLKAEHEKDERGLLKIQQEARARHARMAERIRRAEAVGADTVDSATHDSLEKARRLAAFDKLTETMAELQRNVISEDAATRPGGETPQAWKRNLEALEAEAAANKFEGVLGLRLRAMERELQSQAGRFSEQGAAVRDFEEAVPGVFAGEMGEVLRDAKGDLARFQEAEQKVEESLHALKAQLMRDRISRRMYEEGGEFKERWDHRDALDRLIRGHVAPMAETARGIDRDLEEVIDQRRVESMSLVAAASNTHVPVTRYRSETVGTGKDARTVDVPYTDYEDQSLPYRLAAAAAASAAQAAAGRADQGRQRLAEQVARAKADAVFQREGLSTFVSKDAAARMDQGQGFGATLLLPHLWSLWSSISSSASAGQAKSDFSSVLSEMNGLEAEVGARAGRERQWLHGQVEQDLERQIKTASSDRKTGGLPHQDSSAPFRWASLYAGFPRQAKGSPVDAALELAGTMLLDGRLKETKELLFQLLPDLWTAQITGDTTALIDTWSREMDVALEGDFSPQDLPSLVELAETMAKTALIQLRAGEADAVLPAEVLLLLEAQGIRSPEDFSAFILKVKSGELTPDPKMMAALSGVLEISLTSDRATNLKEALATNRTVHLSERRFDSSLEVGRDAELLSNLKWVNEPASLEALKVLHGEGIHTIGSLRRGVTARELASIKGSSEEIALAVLNTLAVEGISLPPGSPKTQVFHSVGAPAALLTSLVVQGGSVDGTLLGAILLLGLSFPLYLRIKRAFDQRAFSRVSIFTTLAVLSVLQAVALCQVAGLEPLAWFWAFAPLFYAAQGLPLFFNPLRRWDRQVDDFLQQEHALDLSGWNVLDPAPLLDLVARLRADPAINRPGLLGAAAENLVARLRTAWEIKEMDTRSLDDAASGRGPGSPRLADRIAALAPPAPLSAVDAEALVGRWASFRPGDRAAQLRQTAAGQISLLSTRMPAEVFGEWKSFMEKRGEDRPLLAVLDLWGVLWAPHPVLDGVSHGFISELLADPFFRWAHPRLHGVMAARFSNDGTGGDAVLERAVALYRAGRAAEGRAWAEAFFNDLTDARETGDVLVLNDAWTARMENEPAVRLRAEDLPRLQQAAFRLMENDGLPAGDSPVHVALETAESFLRLGQTEEARELLMTLTSALWRAKESGDLKALFVGLEATLHMDPEEGRGSFLIEDLSAAILRVQSMALQLVLMTPKPAEDDSAFFAAMGSEGSSRTLEEALTLNASLYASANMDESVLEDDEARSPIASLPWEEDEISAKALDVLRSAGVLTVGHLTALDAPALLDLPGMKDEVALRILNVLQRDLLPLRPKARVLHSMGGPVGFIGGLVAHLWGANPFAGLTEMPVPQGGALAWGTAGVVVLYGAYKMAPYWRGFVGALMDGVGRIFGRVMNGRRAALALAALLAVSAAEGRAVAGKEELLALAPEASSVGLDAFLSRRGEAGVPTGAALFKEVDHWAYRYNPLFRLTLATALREKRVALDRAAAAAAVSRAVEKEVPTGAAVAAGPGGVFVLTQVLRSEADIPGFAALLAKHKGSAAHVQVLAREENLKARVLAAFADAGLEKVSLDFRASRDVPAPGSREGMSESIAARHAAPWLADLQQRGLRPGTVHFYVSYPADLELLEGDVPELFRRWSAERIRSFLEKAFVVKYQDLNSLGWMARLIAQMA